MYVSDFRAADTPILKDHVVFDTVIMPFVFDVSLAVECASEALGQLAVNGVHVSNLAIFQPVAFPGGESRSMQFIIQRDEHNNQASFESHVLDDATSSWST